MARAPLACLLLLPLLQRCLPSKREPSHSWRDPAFIKRMLAEHNQYRANVTPPAANMLYMSWDEDLAKTACSWARQCTPGPNPRLIIPGSAHPTFVYLGENIWFAYESEEYNPLEMWASEIELYNYQGNNCTSICGHYKQIIWAQTYKVGCSAELCDTLLGTGMPRDPKNRIRFVVCNYAPIGNFLTRRPYLRGKPCSQCPAGDTCADKLCRSSERETSNVSSTWRPPWACRGAAASRCPSALLALASIALHFVA